MFDLFPDVDHLMLDLPPTDPARATADATRSAPARPRGPIRRLRGAIGRHLIAIGSALVIEERATGRSIGR